MQASFFQKIPSLSFVFEEWTFLSALMFLFGVFLIKIWWKKNGGFLAFTQKIPIGKSNDTSYSVWYASETMVRGTQVFYSVHVALLP